MSNSQNTTDKKPKMKKFSFRDFLVEFPTQESCMEFLVAKRWPEGITCRKCEVVRNHSFVESRNCYACNSCGTHVHPTADTIFHRSRTPLTVWFYVVFVLSNTRGGVSAKQIERDTGVTYKTAWRMCNLIRSRLESGDDVLGGEGKVVEVDETYWGAKSKEGKRGRGSENKKPVVGIVERDGKIHAEMIEDVKKKTLHAEIDDHVAEGTEIHTDEHAGYNDLDQAGYAHFTIKHGEKEYVRYLENRTVHTNTIEGFWGNFKMGVKGAHHFVSHKYLNRYLAEHAFRYNHRNEVRPMFWFMMDRVAMEV